MDGETTIKQREKGSNHRVIYVPEEANTPKQRVPNLILSPTEPTNFNEDMNGRVIDTTLPPRGIGMNRLEVEPNEMLAYSPDTSSDVNDEESGDYKVRKTPTSSPDFLTQDVQNIALQHRAARSKHIPQRNERSQVMKQITEVRLNSKGLPLRNGAEICTYFMKSGQCRFGAECYKNHPEEISTGTDHHDQRKGVKRKSDKNDTGRSTPEVS